MSERYRKPQTIDELKQFCADRGMPLERMRFFIGEDYRGARAFGIYEAEDGDFVVYKNKSDGERAVRYKGPNEAYAVNELYEKLKAETQQRRGSRASRSSQRTRGAHKARNILLAVAAAFLLTCAIAVWKVPDRGYYRYDGQSYYYDDSSWYGYDFTVNDWYLIEDVATELTDHYRDYYVSEDYSDSYGVSDFEDSAYYDESDYDSYYSDSDDYDWDSDDWDSWDSFDTDWDSDW